MPIIKSAKKRVRVSNKAAVRNAKTKRTLREAVKALQISLTSGKATEIEKAHKEAISAIDTAAKKNVLHKNKAARKKSQLSSKVKNAGIKVSAKPKTVVTKKTVAKKTVAAKKPVSTKKVTKKTTAKKTTK